LLEHVVGELGIAEQVLDVVTDGAVADPGEEEGSCPAGDAGALLPPGEAERALKPALGPRRPGPRGHDPGTDVAPREQPQCAGDQGYDGGDRDQRRPPAFAGEGVHRLAPAGCSAPCWRRRATG
jgi:hypothetical protein